MKVSKAIEILTDKAPRGYLAFDQDVADALKLGIEALKGITAIRCGAISNVNEPLPGETPEEEVEVDKT